MARKKKEVVELPVIPKGELTKPIGQIAEECYTLYGSYVNNFRALANINDGCKGSYKTNILNPAYHLHQNQGQHMNC